MKTILITGFSGFVGPYLIKELFSCTSENYKLIGLSRGKDVGKDLEGFPIEKLCVDLNDCDQIAKVLELYQPDFIIHLASNSSVAFSWTEPVKSFQNNTNIFLNLIESVRNLNLTCRILSIGSSEEYGIVDKNNIPLKECAPLNPISPYAVARVSQELISKIYVDGYGLDIVMTRSFNHIGPGQKETFVISSFAKQIVKIKRGLLKKGEVGNINVIRDFLDVRDVVKAYKLLLERGKRGEIYNICRGEGHSLKEILVMMEEIADINIQYISKDSLQRNLDNPIIVGCNNKIKNQVNWQPIISLDQSLADILSYWENCI